ncbi:MAG: hypothetical protein AAB393_04730, partial [Bacteroidota bacterium]
ISSPHIILLSNATGRLTFGESGAWNYARTVNSVAIPVHWGNELVGTGFPKHPTRKVFDRPATYEFGTPIGGTYPPWQDPFYWFDGVIPHFELNGQLRVLGRSIERYVYLFRDLDHNLILGLFLLAFMSSGPQLVLRILARQWFVLVPAALALSSYAFVLVSPRYVAAYFLVLSLVAFASARLPATTLTKRFTTGLVVAILISWIGTLATSDFAKGRSALGVARAALSPSHTATDDSSGHVHWKVAQALNDAGAKRGDGIAYIGQSFHFYWARLAGVRVVAEIRQFDTQSPPTSWAADSVLRMLRRPERRHVDFFWRSDSLQQAEVMKTFAKVGATIVVTDAVPSSVRPTGWVRVAKTNYYFHLLTKGNGIR